MGEKTPVHAERRGFEEGVISAVSVGGFFVLLGLMFVITPDLLGKATNFFNHFSTVQVSSTTVFLPAPTNPAAHTGLYSAAAQFELGVGILQILVIVLRVAMRSRVRRIAENVGNLVFWFGASYLTSAFLNSSTTLQIWFEFWAAIVVLIGVSLVTRALVLLARRML